MKDSIVEGLVSFAKKHPKAKGFIVGLLTIFLAVYHFGKSLFKNRIFVYTTFIILCVLFVSIILFRQESVALSGSNISQNEILQDSMGSNATVHEEKSTVIATEDFIGVQNENDNFFKNKTVSPLDSVTDSVSENIQEEPETKSKVTLPYDSSEQWSLVLFNKENPIPEDYEVELVSIGKKGKCDVRVKEPLENLLADAKQDGCGIYVTSAYRTNSRQTSLYNRKVKNNMRSGDDEEDAVKKAGQIVAVPGTSEHEAGLSFDFLESGYSELDEGFESTKTGKWLRSHGADYGFILRYPKGKEDITGTSYEPWHYRYVGVTAARAIMENELTLEEYLINVGE